MACLFFGSLMSDTDYSDDVLVLVQLRVTAMLEISQVQNLLAASNLTFSAISQRSRSSQAFRRRTSSGRASL